MKFPQCCSIGNWGEDFTLPVHPRSPFSQGCCHLPGPVSLLHSPFCGGLVKAFFPLLAPRTFVCGAFHVEWLFTQGLSWVWSPQKEKSDTKPTTTNPDLYMLLVVTVFNMAQYWIIINSFCFIGISLSHIKTPLCHRKSMFILKNRWGLRFGFFWPWC